MAQIPNKNAQSVSDGLNTYWNIDTSGSHAQLTNADLSMTQSATTPATGAAGTIATAGLVVSRVTPAAARTGCILQAGTQPGQLCLVMNEGSLANSITFDVSGTSNVADGINDVIWGGQVALYVWNSAQSLWFRHGGLISGGLQPTLASATSPDPGAAGTINTAGVGRARVTPAAARTGIILQAGTFDGQEVIVVNEGAAANTLTLNTTPATSNVADSATETAIAGLTARKYVWTDGAWYPFRD